MAVKYHCPTCGRCFVEWGAIKLEFKCPEACNHAGLVLPGTDNTNIGVKPKPKRAKKTLVPITNPEDRLSELDADIVDHDSNDTDTVINNNPYDDDSDDDDGDDDDDDDPIILEKETAATESHPSDKTRRSQPVGDTKGKKEKSKAQKQKSAKDATAAKIIKDKAPKSKAS